VQEINWDCCPLVRENTHASALVRSYLQAGEAVDWKFVQERLGHASVVTTMQTYTHLTNEDRKWAYELYQERRSKRAQPGTDQKQ
jgi:integrase/recombinase XerD